jgi:hypothetical protein
MLEPLETKKHEDFSQYGTTVLGQGFGDQDQG